jgi:glycosyltransferase involved in cell wall biosynthesis
MNFQFPELDYSLGSLLFLLLLIASGIQFLLLVLIHIRLSIYSTKKAIKNNTEFLPISVVIAARNEEFNLSKNLSYILEQDYPCFEVVVVNHQSSDETSFILKAFQEKYKHLHVVEISRNSHAKYSKKIPLTLGIKGAKYPHLVLTDADCRPASNQWLKLMAGKLNSKTDLVLGYGPYEKKPGFLNRFIRFDTAFIASNYFAFALAKMPYMGVGRNMAYSKKLFEKTNGFKSHYAIPSGDDDLFVQEAKPKDNFTVQLEEQSFCISKAKTSWKDWAFQKQRHFGTSPHYRVFHKLLLGIYPFSLLMLFISFVTLIPMGRFQTWSLIVFAFVIVLKWVIQGINLAKLKEKKLAWAFPFFDLLYAFVLPYLYYTTEKKSNRWT